MTANGITQIVLYLVILTALAYPLGAYMNLGSPYSAIISAIIFNALVIPALVPLALRGVKYRAIGATALLRRNLVIYGLGGVILPFIGIKLIDLLVHNLLGA